MTSLAALRRAPWREIEPEDQARAVFAKTEGKTARPGYSAGYVPHDCQRAAHWVAQQPAVDVTVVNAGRRGGKDEWTAAEFRERIQRDVTDKLTGRGRWDRAAPYWQPVGKSPDPFLHYFAVAPIARNLRQLKRKLQRHLGLHEHGGWIVHQDEQRQHWWLAGGVLIDFLSADRPERNVGEGYDGGIFTEAARCKPTLWDEHLQPALADQGGWAIANSTPLGKLNWFYRLWSLGDPVAAADLAADTGEDPELDPYARCLQWTSLDNDRAPKVIEYAERMRLRMSGPMWRRSFLADWDSFIGQIFQLRASQRRTSPVPVMQIARRMGGMDFGQASPGVLTTVVEDSLGFIHEEASHSATGLDWDGDEAWSRRASGDRSTWTNVAWGLFQELARGMPDLGTAPWKKIPLYLPHDQPAVTRMFQRRGFNVRTAHLKREDRLVWAQCMLAEGGGATVSSPVLWRCLQGLRYDKAGELWEKDGDHAFDAWTYACTEQVQGWAAPRGGLVSISGWRRR